MDKFIIKGPAKLKGEILTSGSKNAALPILMATLLTDEECVLERVPDLRDIRTTLKLLEFLGKKTEYKNGVAKISFGEPLKKTLPYDLVKQMRASFWVAGPLLARFKEAEIPLPGGCAIGVRPVDIHLKGFEKLGAEHSMKKGDIFITARELKPAKIVFRFPSVGATHNLLMAASLIEGETVLENTAQEPEIDDMIAVLRKMGSEINIDAKGAVKIKGAEKLGGFKHTVVADRIESGTYMLAAAITGGDVWIRGCEPVHNEILLECLKDAGCEVEVKDKDVRVARKGKIKPVNVSTMPYPGFATDLQAPWMAFMCLSDGYSEINEDIFENRFMHAPELVRMGADITINNSSAGIKGVPCLSGAEVMSSDLRGGAALVLAGICAKDKTEVDRIYHIDRGYERMEEKLRGAGADIIRVNPSKNK